MNSRNAIQQELNDLRSSLPLINNEQPVFTVPEGYFENFAASVMATIKSQPVESVATEMQGLSSVLAAIPRQTPYQVPENYFSNLATNLPALVNDEALPDLLQTHTKQMPYTLPDGYFEGLATQVAAKLPRPQAKVVPLFPRVVRLAAAAAIIGIIAVAGFLYADRNNSAATPDPTKQPTAWIAQKLKNVPDRDLEAFLKTTGSATNNELARGGNSDVQQMLRDVSNNELDAFLKELPADNSSNIN